MNKEEAIKIVRSHYPANKQMLNEALEFLIPELKEDENEKIRKEIIAVFKGQIAFTSEEDTKKYIAWLEKQVSPEDKGEISDGYHTFNELYYYRMLYNAAFFNSLPKVWVHKSKKHHDGEECFGGGWFIVMANLPTGQISNHYELKDWELFQIPEKEVADEWDGHTPKEAAERLHKYLLRQKEQELLCAKCRKDNPYSSCQEVTAFGNWTVEDEPTQANKVEPKFKVGDWVVRKNGQNFCNGSKFVQITEIDGEKHWFDCRSWLIDKDVRLWTINDAEDGDLIYVSTKEKSIAAIFDKVDNGIIYFHCYICGDFTQGGHMSMNSVELIYPLQKANHQRLFQKMKEAGYEWDAGKKELKNLIKYL